MEERSNDPRGRTTLVTEGRGRTGDSPAAGWFIAGGLAVLVIVMIWLVSGGVFDRTPTGDGPDDAGNAVETVD